MPEIEVGVTKMAADLTDDRAGLIYDETAQSHSGLMTDTRASEQGAHAVLRYSNVRKYDEVGPLESAAAEMILGKAQKVALATN